MIVFITCGNSSFTVVSEGFLRWSARKRLPFVTRDITWSRCRWMKHECNNRQSLRAYSTKCEDGYFYASTPIFYVNAGPHIGHLYSALLADAMTRYKAMRGEKTFLSTGTDEHGNKVESAARSAQSPVKNYCDDVSSQFKKMCDQFEIRYDRFIRTTDQQHVEAVQHFWRELDSRGHIYLGKYSGWYCLADEAFITSAELIEKKDAAGQTIRVSAESGHPVQWTEEDNYKFRLSSFQSDLKYWLKDEKRVQPSKFHKILLDWIEEGSCLEDLSVSRPIKRASWGIRVPNDEEHTVYVWLDALVNYLTSMGYPSRAFSEKHWPPSLQVIGKDILKFHGVYWPAFLIAAGLEPPKMLLCHSHWTVNDEKMSKSKGNVVSPFNAAKSFTNDGLRYFLLREAVPHSDANYSESKIFSILNPELADTFGNLFSRCMGKAINPEGKIGDPHQLEFDRIDSEEAKELIESLTRLREAAEHSYGEFNLHHVVDGVIKSLHLTNRMLERHKPWQLKKEFDAGNLDSGRRLDVVLSLALEATRMGALVLSPIVPNLCSKLLDYMGIPRECRTWSDVKFTNAPSSRQFTEDSENRPSRPVLFQRLKAQ